MLSPSATPARLWATLRREFRVGDPGSLRAHLIRSAGGSFALQVASKLLSVAIGVLLARALGASGYGVYALAFAWLQLLMVPTTLGLPTLIMRHVVVYSARQDWSHLRGLLVRANQAVLGTSLLLTLLAGATTWLLADRFQNPHALTTFWLALLLLPLFGLTAVRSACLHGLHRVVLGQTPESLVRPALFLALTGAVWLLHEDLTPRLAMGLQLVAVGCAFVLGAVWLLRSLPREMKGVAPAYATRAWAGSALPFLLVGGLHLINAQADTIMLGWFRTAADVGVYRVASIGAGLVFFTFAAVYNALAPSVARLYAEGDVARLQRVITLSARMILLCSLPVALALIFLGRWLLSSIFGLEYAVGATALAILAFGQLVTAGMGFAVLILNMTGHERDTARSFTFSAILNVTLNAFFIPLWGINGAALASVGSLVTGSVLTVVLVHRRLGLRPTALGSLRPGRRNVTEINNPGPDRYATYD
jgi:O-antigen/teichoic acid export membrane protein